MKNPPSNAGDAALIPGQGTKIPQATGQLSPCAKTQSPRALERVHTHPIGSVSLENSTTLGN